MKLTNAKYSIDLEFTENQVNCLVVENQSAMLDIINDLYQQIQGNDGVFVLQNNDKEIKISKNVDLILEPFTLNINNKKNLSQLYSSMAEYCNDIQYMMKSEINEKIINLIDETGVSLAHNIRFNLDYTPELLFKMMDVKFNEDYESLKEKIIQYIDIISSLNSILLIIFVNFKTYFSNDDIKEIYNNACCRKIHILCIENYNNRQLDIEKCCIIDKDLCIINP